jgi:hypothetical protein
MAKAGSSNGAPWPFSAGADFDTLPLDISEPPMDWNLPQAKATHLGLLA